MGDFFDAIRNDLDALDGAGRGLPYVEFGADYSSTPDTLKQIQAAINKLGYTPALVVDGMPGPKTTAGVKWAQTQKGITADGIPGDGTLQALGIASPGGTGAAAATASSPPSEGLLSRIAHLFSHVASAAAGAVSGRATHPSVWDAFPKWTQKYEGRIPWMYPDLYGLVSSGVGNLLDSSRGGGSTPWSMALGLPWVHKGDMKTPATQAEIIADWQAVKAQPDIYKTKGAGGYSSMTQLRLTDAAIDKLVQDKMAQNEAVLVKRFPNFAQWPADAQLAHHSTAWAWGPAFKWDSNYDTVVNQAKPDWAAALKYAQSANANEEARNPGIRPRNAAQWTAYQNAAAVQKSNSDASKLWWPASAPVATWLGFGLLGYWFAGGLVTIVSVFGYRFIKTHASSRALPPRSS